jgi:hypothetical protein
MIKTLRITSAAAVVLAVVVLASVLGFLRPASLVHLNFGARDDKQIGKILDGASAVERFKAQTGDKASSSADTTPPLVKQADLFAEIINPPASVAAPKLPSQLPPKPVAGVKPFAPVSGKFELLGTCYSADPKTSFAYIQLPDKTYRWVGVGSEIGHATIKEIRSGSIVYLDGIRDVEMNATSTPETSSLLETGKTPATPAASQLPPAVGGKTSISPASPASPVKPFVASSRTAALRPPLPSTQISKEEQENLSRLGNKLKASAAADPNAAANKLISDYKSSSANPPRGGILPSPGDANASKSDWKDSMREEARRQWQNRLAAPRSTKK